MLNLTPIECAYLAGLFDGEGSVGYYFKTASQHHTATVQISNSSPEIMGWLREKLPFGSIAVTNNSKCKYTCWNWICASNGRSREFLNLIRPYLIFKGKQVDLLFSLWDAEQKAGCGRGKRVSAEIKLLRDETREHMKRLKTSSYQLVSSNSEPLYGPHNSAGEPDPENKGRVS